MQFKGETYTCRIVESNEGEELIIAPYALLDALRPGVCEHLDGFADDEAVRIYDEIFYFTDKATLRLPDNELVEELKEDNPDWFE